MILSRRNVFSAAWYNAKNDADARWVYDWTPGRTYGTRHPTTAAERRAVFARHLHEAWASAKREAELAAKAPEEFADITAADLAAEIEVLENTGRLGWEGIERLSRLRRAHSAKVRDELEERWELIRAAHGRFVGVTFTKKDGSTRHMTVQPAALRHHVKGLEAAPAARRAAETPAQRHPNAG